MSRALPSRHRAPALRPGQEWWEDNPHRLAARVRVEVRKGRVQEVHRVQLSPARHGSLIVRLKPRPPAWRKPVVLAATGLAGAGLGVALAIQAFTLLVRFWPYLAGLAVVVLVVPAVLGHRPGCTGLHCSGCRR